MNIIPKDISKNCVKCGGSYSPYKAGEESDKFQSWCILPILNLEPSGLCGHCNPKSMWFINK